MGTKKTTAQRVALAAKRAGMKAEREAAKAAGLPPPVEHNRRESDRPRHGATHPVEGPGGPADSAAANAAPAAGAKLADAVLDKKQDIKVQATRLGYYEHARRRTGDVFVIHSLREFSSKWMVRVAPETPERITTGKQDLQRQHDEINAQRMAGAGAPAAAPTGAAEAI